MATPRRRSTSSSTRCVSAGLGPRSDLPRPGPPRRRPRGARAGRLRAGARDQRDGPGRPPWARARAPRARRSRRGARADPHSRAGLARSPAVRMLEQESRSGRPVRCPASASQRSPTRKITTSTTPSKSFADRRGHRRHLHGPGLDGRDHRRRPRRQAPDHAEDPSQAVEEEAWSGACRRGRTAPVVSSTQTRSVKVPPMSTPIREGLELVVMSLTSCGGSLRGKSLHTNGSACPALLLEHAGAGMKPLENGDPAGAPRRDRRARGARAPARGGRPGPSRSSRAPARRRPARAPRGRRRGGPGRGRSDRGPSPADTQRVLEPSTASAGWPSSMRAIPRFTRVLTSRGFRSRR